MNENNSILLVSDDLNTSKMLKSKLIFLRKNDTITVSDYVHLTENVNLLSPNVVIVVENNSQEQTLDAIRSLRKNVGLCIILLAKNNDSAFILESYDAGCDDFMLVNVEAFELVIRIVNNIKHNSVHLKALRNTKILEQLNVVDNLTGLYNFTYAKQVVENCIDYNLIDNATFMVVAPMEASKSLFSLDKMASSILKSIRVEDIATLGKGAKFYLFLPKTDFNGAIVVLNKIKEVYGEDFKISAGISSIENKSFDEFEHDALHALSDALAKNVAYIFAKDKEDTLDSWLEDSDDEPKNYKLFRQIFNKKMERVITPVFYRLQKAWEEKLFNTEIEQFTDSEQCVFHLKNQKQDSTLRIVYPGFANIIISIKHEGLDSPENQEIQLPLSKISQKELIEIVENFIKEFKYTSI